MMSGSLRKVAHFNTLIIDKVPIIGMAIQGKGNNITLIEGTRKILDGETKILGNKRSTICIEGNNKSFIIRPVQDMALNMTKH